MDNPKLYNESNGITKCTTIKCLDEYTQKVKWRDSGDSIIDLGCGEGNVTRILKAYVPTNYEKFVACDINENMLKFARQNLGGQNITFRVQDVEGDLADDLKSSFNHVFSFFLFHWIRKQERAFHNIYDLLSPRGDCYVIFFSDMPFYRVYEVMARDSKWGKTWLKDVFNVYMSPYYGMKDPDRRVRNILESAGFVDIDVQCKEMTYAAENVVEMKNLLQSVDPYRMPDDVFEDFFMDFLGVAKDIGFLDKSINTMDDVDIKVIFDFTLIVVHASKP